MDASEQKLKEAPLVAEPKSGVVAPAKVETKQKSKVVSAQEK